MPAPKKPAFNKRPSRVINSIITPEQLPTTSEINLFQNNHARFFRSLPSRPGKAVGR
jgi:hypothetical protein